MNGQSKRHHNWKGDDVGYAALHEWVAKRIPKPKLCLRCQKSEPKDLSCNGIYNRNPRNWEWLCRSCHLKKDGRNHKGEKNGGAKLTMKQIQEIRAKHDGKWGSFSKLGREYGVCGWTISQVIKKRTWVCE